MVQFVTLPNLSNYQDTLKLMENKVASIIEKSSPEVVYLVEHDSVYTAGTSCKADENLSIYSNDLENWHIKQGMSECSVVNLRKHANSPKFCDANASKQKSIPLVYTGRGGKLTYHGEGQRVIYPILDLSSEGRQKDLRLYIRMLEEWIIKSLLHLGVRAFTIDGMVGIWVQDNGLPAKIASIGVRVKKWVTYHGIAVNISTDLSMFSSITPCGLTDARMISLKKLGVNVTLNEFDSIIKEEFVNIF